MGEEQLVTLQPGQRCNKWTITKKLGAGAFGAVYLCTHGNLTAALKTEPLNANPPLLAMEVRHSLFFFYFSTKNSIFLGPGSARSSWNKGGQALHKMP